MKKIVFTLISMASFWANAQQKNSLLDPAFWKTAPDVAAVQAEMEKGNSPSELTSTAFDATTLAINSNAPVATIKFLLAQSGNPITKLTHDNRIYLHWAANKGNIEIVDYLIAKGAAIHLEDSKGETPLTFAASNGQTNPQLYESFFKAGIDPKKKYKDGVTLMLKAIPMDNTLVLSNYLTTKGLSLNDVDNNGLTAFDYAARTGNVAFLKTLLSKGVKPTNGALLMAAQGSRRETTALATYQFLIDELKIDPKTKGRSNETVLHVIANKPNQKEIISYFLAKGLDPNATDVEGNTALMLAASGNDLAVVEQLALLTKNCNAQNVKKETALTYAVKSGTPEIFSFLVNNRGDLSVLDKDDFNLGYYLIQYYKPQSGERRGAGVENGTKKDPFDAKIAIFKEKGFDLAAPQKEGSTLYHFAVIKNDLNLLEKLASLNINVNAKNKDGLTALHKAAMLAKDDAILKYLLSIGAQKESKTDFDETAYTLAKENESLTKKKTDVEFLK
ncbi:ankyrin repeat domain-containing protein [Flavobacterium sp. TSSA_36]|uniref:ankyrin repeat domain-containing protein n=1 Tax=Flavobacterium sp. TSSA_36 TaxID=3447669 RepID=UPI003F308DFF